jgi:hypothetical protein
MVAVMEVHRLHLVQSTLLVAVVLAVTLAMAAALLSTQTDKLAMAAAGAGAPLVDRPMLHQVAAVSASMVKALLE